MRARWDRWEDNKEDRALKLSKLRKKGARGPKKCFIAKRTQAPSRLDNENGQMQSLEDFYNAELALTSSNGQHSIYKFHIPIENSIIKIMHSYEK